jgi:phosphate transport system permease protein
VGESLFRVLFLSAVILFALTFILNTVAEIVRQRLRSKYGKF